MGKCRFYKGLLLSIIAFSSFVQAQQGVVLDDTFNLMSLNGAVWDNKTHSPSSAYISEANGVLRLHGTSAYPAAICSKSSLWVQPGANQTVRVIFANITNVGSNGAVELSFSNGANRSPVHFGITASNGVTTFLMADGTTGFNDSYVMSGAPLGGTWKIEWQPTRVKVYRYDSLFFDSSVNAGQTNGTLAGQWPIPSKPLGVYVHSVPDYTSIDWIRASFIPECGSTGYLKANINADCSIDLFDFSAIGENWLVDGGSDLNPNFQTGRGYRLLRTFPFVISGLSIPFPYAYNLDRLRNCGLNAFMEWRGTGDFMQYTKSDFLAAIDHNMPWMYFTSHEAMTTAEVDEFAKWPGRAIFNVIDEPTRIGTEPHNFEASVATVQYIKDNYPDKPALANIGIGPRNETEYADKDGELDDFVNIMKPDILSEDIWPLHSDGGTGENELWAGMKLTRDHALVMCAPYWVWIPIYDPDTQYHSYRRPSESDLRYMVYKHLAFGYTGVLYNTYDTTGPATNDPGLVDSQGTNNCMPQYYYAQDVDIEVNNLGPALKRLMSKAVYHAGPNNPWPAHCTDFSSYGNMTAFNASGSNWTLGFFEDIRGQQYFMIVNDQHGMNQSAALCAKTAAITFNSSINSLQKIDRRTGQVTTVSLTNHVLNLTLPGGTGDLFKYDTGQAFTTQLCGENGYSNTDLNHDCKTDITDLSIVTEVWLVCSLPGQPLNYWDCNSQPSACRWAEENWRVENYISR